MPETDSTDQLALARHKAVRRAIDMSRLQTTLDEIHVLAAEAVTPRNEWGDGYRQAQKDLREILTAFAPAAGQPVPLAVGDVIHALDSEVFGHDRYDCLRVEAVGSDWVVARDPYRPHTVVLAAGEDRLTVCQQARDQACPVDSPCPLDASPPLTTWSPR